MSDSKKTTKDKDERITIRLWPKTPLLYPMAFMALVCGIVGDIFGVPVELTSPHGAAAIEEVEPSRFDNEVAPEPVFEKAVEDLEPAAEESEKELETEAMLFGGIDKSKSGLINTILALVFLTVFACSLFVSSIDFEVRWSLLAFGFLLIIAMAVFVAEQMGKIELPNALSVIDNFTLYATPPFYYAIFGIWLLLMLVSAIIARLHYVRIEHNEVVVYGGLMESQKRMSTFRMHWTKEIDDVFEYWLPFVRSGTLVFSFPNEDKPLILNNVIGIDKVIKKLNNKSGSFQVKEVE